MLTIFTQRIKTLLAEMGFTCNEDKWIAHFQDANSGMIFKCEAVEANLKSGTPILVFNCYDENSVLLGMNTLDQMLMGMDRDFTVVPHKSNKKYITTYKLEVSIETDMNDVPIEKYIEIKNDFGLDYESSIAERIARTKLEDVVFEIPGTEFVQFDCLDTQEKEF